MSVEDEALLAAPGPRRQAALNPLLFPVPTRVFTERRARYGDTSQMASFWVWATRSPRAIPSPPPKP